MTTRQLVVLGISAIGLVTQIRCVAPSPSGPTPSDIAQRMVETGGPKSFTTQPRTNETTAAAIMDWSDAFEKSGIERPHALVTLLLIPGIHEAFNETGEFQMELQKRLTDRLRNLSKSMVDDWREVLEKASTQSVEPWEAAIYIIRYQPIWKGTELTPDSEVPLIRMRSIPPKAIAEWASVLGSGDDQDRRSAALSLAMVDTLFENNVFKSDAFDAALPLAQSLLQKQESKTNPH